MKRGPVSTCQPCAGSIWQYTDCYKQGNTYPMSYMPRASIAQPHIICDNAAVVFLWYSSQWHLYFHQPLIHDIYGIYYRWQHNWTTSVLAPQIYMLLQSLRDVNTNRIYVLRNCCRINSMWLRFRDVRVLWNFIIWCWFIFVVVFYVEILSAT